MSTTHTPTPLVRVCAGDRTHISFDGLVKPINCGSEWRAATIAHRWNSHAALVEALEKAQARLKILRVCVPTYAVAAYLLDLEEIAAAIKAAKGEA